MAARVQRRRRGTGGIFRVDEDRWRVDVELPREAGQPRRRMSRHVHGTYDDAQRELALLSPTQAPRTVAFNVRMTESLADQLRQTAATHGVSIAEEIRRAVRAHVTGEQP